MAFPVLIRGRWWKNRLHRDQVRILGEEEVWREACSRHRRLRCRHPGGGKSIEPPCRTRQLPQGNSGRPHRRGERKRTSATESGADGRVRVKCGTGKENEKVTERVAKEKMQAGGAARRGRSQAMWPWRRRSATAGLESRNSLKKKTAAPRRRDAGAISRR